MQTRFTAQKTSSRSSRYSAQPLSEELLLTRRSNNQLEYTNNSLALGEVSEEDGADARAQ